MSFDFSTLVTDRLQSDVDERNAKGTYNAADLNRVTVALEFLDRELSSVGYITGYERVKETDWTESDIPTASQMDKYLENARKIRSAIKVMESTPNVPKTMAFLTFQKANDIEKILLDVESLINSMRRVYMRAGTIFSHAGYTIYAKN